MNGLKRIALPILCFAKLPAIWQNHFLPLKTLSRICLGTVSRQGLCRAKQLTITATGYGKPEKGTS